MARQFYRVLTKSFINNSIVEEGAVVQYEGKPGSNLEPCDEDGNPIKVKKAKQEPDPAAEAEAKAKAEAEAKAKGSTLA